jgi:hypothetical protein
MPSITDSGPTADLHREHHPHQRQAAAAAQQEQRAQRRTRRQVEGQLEAGLRVAGPGLDLHRAERFHELLRRRAAAPGRSATGA